MRLRVFAVLCLFGVPRFVGVPQFFGVRSFASSLGAAPARRARGPCYGARIPVIALVNLLFGIGFALIARDRVRADGPFSSPAFPLVALHAGAIVMPIALYFYAVHPAWSWMYFFDPAKMSGIAILPLMVGHAGLVIGGWYVASMLLRRGFQMAVLYSGGVITLTLLVLVVSGITRLTTAADYPGWIGEGKGHGGVGAFSVQLGWAFLVSLLAIALSGVYVAIELNRDGRRVRSR